MERSMLIEPMVVLIGIFTVARLYGLFNPEDNSKFANKLYVVGWISVIVAIIYALAFRWLQFSV